MKGRSPALLVCAITALACAAKFAVPPIAATSTPPIPAGSSALVVVPPDGRDGRGAVYEGSGSWVAAALATGLVGRRVSASVAPEVATDAAFRVEPTIRNWSDRLTEWSGIPDRVTLQVRVVDAASGRTLDDREIEASSRWLTFGGDHPQDLLPELADQWAASVVR